jgi:NADP-dependent 3-hydroxy acid dehydrogenase YdfG
MALVIFDVLRQSGDEAVAELSAMYQIPVVFHQVDVCNQKNVQDAVEATVQQFGKIDILVASAGIAE